MLVSAFFEMISLGAVVPFIGALVSPDKVFNQPLVRRVAETFGVSYPDQLVIPLTIAFIVAAFTSAAIRLLLTWVSTKFSNAIGADFSIEMYRRTLHQPYRVHLERNSSEVISGITTKSWICVSVLQYFLGLISSTVLFITLLFTLIAIDPLATGIAVFFFGVSYGLITLACRRRLRIYSEQMARESTRVVKALQEGLGGIRDVLLSGSQAVYCDIYRQADLPYREANGSIGFIAASPRFVMEAFGMALIAGLACGLSRGTGGIANTLPVLGALAIGAQRLLPTLQQIYGTWTSIVAHQSSLSQAIDLLDQPLPVHALAPEPEPMEFKDTIRLRSVSFRYLKDGPCVLDGLNLTIPKGDRVGFVGVTGSGKSTLLDLIMGLLEPIEGEILVDGLPITDEYRRSWQRTIAHVPQSVFLADISVAENIAFGIPRHAIDMERVRNAAQQAQISGFIESCRDGYNAYVGERGIRLSGGQRQRIGIARALYKQVSVLVFDEATSSLDNATEQAVMDSIENLNRDLTIFIVAHRLTTVRRCDNIVELAHGRVVAQGSYEQLLERSPSFRRMALVVA
jgi:ATP-binding cassette subfamily B protein